MYWYIGALEAVARTFFRERAHVERMVRIDITPPSMTTIR
jgi:hypothetical protein